MHTKGELRLGERESEDGKRSEAERWVMELRERAIRPQRALGHETGFDSSGHAVILPGESA